ncbi:MAG: aminoacetone oxidase family FAD-binding enzyme [Anaerolineales bacterium]
MNITIIGAGASGILAAILAAQGGARVTLYDTNARVGRKLLITGNGRCNLSNLQAHASRYACADQAAISVALQAFGVPQTRDCFRRLGIPTFATPDGWCYPLSESAAAVAEILAARLAELGVILCLQTKVADLRPRGSGWELALGGPEKWVSTDRVIVACGGAAYPALGSKGELWPVLQRLGHTVLPAQPALAPITADVRSFHNLQGVRLDAQVSLWAGGECLGDTYGNVMFTQYGFSGPAAMDLGHLVHRHLDRALTLRVDVLAGRRELLHEIVAIHPNASLFLALAALLPIKLARALPGLSGLPADILAGELGTADATGHFGQLEANVTGTRGLQEAQLSSGGVPITEIAPTTMASRLLSGLYFCGEVLDVVGPCGGYNLQWAWTSGALAGAAAANGST